MIQTGTVNDTRTLKADNGYHCLQAARLIKKGDVILELKGRVNPERTRYSIQVSKDRHIESEYSPENHSYPEAQWRFMNHSCKPNAYLKFPGLELVALADIQAGEEIFYNYLSTELQLISPFECNCGTPECYKNIRGYKYLSPQERQQLAYITAPHLVDFAKGK